MWDGERVCRLQLLLALANAVILGSEFRGKISESRLPSLEGQVLVFISPLSLAIKAAPRYTDSARTA
jgi:hypothetical protein